MDFALALERLACGLLAVAVALLVLTLLALALLASTLALALAWFSDPALGLDLGSGFCIDNHAGCSSGYGSDFGFLPALPWSWLWLCF